MKVVVLKPSCFGDIRENKHVIAETCWYCDWKDECKKETKKRKQGWRIA